MPRAVITIRPQMVKDAARFYKILTTGNFRFFPLNISSIEAEKRFLRNNVRNFKEKKTFNFSILLEGEVIGAIGLIPETGRNYNAEVGYFIDRRYHGQGITTEAVRLVEEYALSKLPFINRLQAIMVVENLPSARVVEKAGFKKEGLLHSYLCLDGHFHDVFIYGKIIR